MTPHHSTAPPAGEQPATAAPTDETGSFAVFVAVIMSALLFLGGLAYDGPRLIAARQDAVHLAYEAARVAAGTVASGGTLEQARDAAQKRVDVSGLIYGQRVQVAFLDCVGSRVQVTIVTGYVFRSVLAVPLGRKPIEAVGAAEAQLVLPSDDPASLHYLSECPLE